MAETSLAGKVALLTGAEDEPGYSLALCLAKSGCKIILAGSTSSLVPVSNKLKSSSNIQEQDAHVKVLELDVCSGEKNVDAAVQKGWQFFGEINVLVNCTNYSGALAPFLDITEEQWEKTIRVNIHGVWVLAKALARRMQARQIGGSFIFITSIAGSERGLFLGTSAYSTSMAAVQYLSKMLAIELGKYRIRVNAVARGFNSNDMVFQSIKSDSIQELASKLPLQRWADVSRDFSSIVCFLASDDASFITGTTTFVDGGQSIVRTRLRSFM